MAHQPDDSSTSVDVVIPVFNERPDALAATLAACLKQTHSVSTIFVVDDGSLQPVCLPDWAAASGRITLLRLARNYGISAARNVAIAHARAQLVACINAEVVPDPDWLATCKDYLFTRPKVGACYTRIVPQSADRILTRWRMRFHEANCGEQSGPALFAPGHAALFRRTAVEAVGGYDPRYRLNHEDSDICQRMMKSGWETHYIAQSRCISIQADSLKSLASKQLERDTDWSSCRPHPLVRAYFQLSKWTLARVARNIVKGRLYFVPIDVAIWAYALWIAASRPAPPLSAKD